MKKELQQTYEYYIEEIAKSIKNRKPINPELVQKISQIQEAIRNSDISDAVNKPLERKETTTPLLNKAEIASYFKSLTQKQDFEQTKKGEEETQKPFDAIMYHIQKLKELRHECHSLTFKNMIPTEEEIEQLKRR